MWLIASMYVHCRYYGLSVFRFAVMSVLKLPLTIWWVHATYRNFAPRVPGSGGQAVNKWKYGQMLSIYVKNVGLWLAQNCTIDMHLAPLLIFVCKRLLGRVNYDICIHITQPKRKIYTWLLHFVRQRRTSSGMWSHDVADEHVTKIRW